jgi:two-component system nitrogen regulation response regulator NtrX
LNESNKPDFKIDSIEIKNDLKTATKNIVEDFERSFILQKLRKNQWNISKTARIMGISRGALHSKINDYKLNQDN